MLFKYASVALRLSDVADEMLHVVSRKARHRGHISEEPVVLHHTLIDGVADAEVGVVAGFVYLMDKGRACVGPGGANTVAGRAVGVKDFLAR